ncbi:MAG: Gfo/Idh/MocA family oxidoreductase [Planctomycetes bacterium]|nr:Gfo/Idh/MocA family oxidoreductase [Planctomycetota bacterium]
MDVRVAVAGMGYWGKNLVRNLHELGALQMVCDSDPEREQVVKDTYPTVEFTSGYADVLADDRLHAVVLATPAVRHYQMAKQAIEAGKDVYVEKPLALTVADGEELNALAERHGRILMVGHILRYHPAVVKLGELVDSGELGRIRYLYSNRLNMGKIRTEENILWSFAPHDISVMLALLQEGPSYVSCQGASYLNKGVADVTLSQFAFPSGVRAHIFVSWLHPFKEQRLVVVGSEKMAVFDDTAREKLVLFPHKVEWKHRVPTAVKAEGQPVEIDSAEPLRMECAHFLECVSSRNTPTTDGAEGLRVLKILDACQKQLVEAQGIAPPTGIGAAEEKPYFAHPTAVIDEPVEIGEGTKIWHFAHILKNSKIGTHCTVGQNVMIGPDVTVGDGCKIQNNVSVFKGVTLEDHVFCGPSCVFTNVFNPRSELSRMDELRPTFVRRGATIGANATIVCGHTVGEYAFIGAGAVVTKDVPAYALMYGNPAAQNGWMCRCGAGRLDFGAANETVCPACGRAYVKSDGDVAPREG